MTRAEAEAYISRLTREEKERLYEFLKVLQMERVEGTVHGKVN